MGKAAVFFSLTRRHLAVFFKNKIQVLYTLLVPVIIFAVYLLFLRSMELMSVENALLSLKTPVKLAEHPQLTKRVGTVVDGWMLAGIAALSAVTVAFQTNNVIVEDKERGVNRDFASAPVPRSVLIASYFLFSFFVTAFICLVFEFICFVYFAATGEFVFGAADVLLSLAAAAYICLGSTLAAVFLCAFFKTQAALAGLIAAVSTGVGFLIGAYMPLAMLPSWVQSVCAFIPGTFGCALLRYTFLRAPLAALAESVSASAVLSDAAVFTEIAKTFGYRVVVFGKEVSPAWQAAAVAAYTVLFAGLNALSGKRLAAVSSPRPRKKGRKERMR